MPGDFAGGESGRNIVNRLEKGGFRTESAFGQRPLEQRGAGINPHADDRHEHGALKLC